MNRPITHPIPLDGIEVRVSPALVGSSKAVQFGHGPVLVSPAMYELMSKAETEGELRRLLESIPVLRLPAQPSPFDPLPMTT